VKAYDAFAGANGDPLLRDTARLRAALTQMDTGDAKDALARLTPLANADGAFHYTARELLGVLAISQDDLDAAGLWLDMIVTDPNAPPNMRQRAEAFLAIVRSGRKPKT
jgi:hypothetical protein